MKHSRRAILRFAGAAVTITPLWACANEKTATRSPSQDARRSQRVFPQGVASADPQPNGVLLWTRAVPTVPARTMRVYLQVSSSPDFKKIYIEHPLEARADDDFTLRAYIDNLSPNSVYYYRFIAEEGSVSRTGRTWTAPAAEDDQPTNIAFICCHNYRYGFFGGYRRLINDFGDLVSGKPGLDFILHLGDFIYENEGRNPRKGPIGRDGKERIIAPFPSGGMIGFQNQTVAATLADYRHLYRAYLEDPDLQEARALFPFVSVWDDHEFADDAWQTFSDGKAQPKRRFDAMKAWSEFIPALLTECGSVAGVDNEARDFKAPDRPIVDGSKLQFDDDFQISEDNNRAAIDVTRIYRTLRWGKNLDLILTDQRSYKSAPASLGDSLESLVGNAPSPGNPENGIPDDIVRILALGREANSGNPPSTLRINGEDVPNPRKDAPPVTVLGRRQKQWFASALKSSRARWKVWGSSSPLMRFGEDMSTVNPSQNPCAMWLEDTWDGFPNERKELMALMRSEGIVNVVSLSGDRHLHAAGLVAEDYAKDNPDYVMPDFAVTSLSMATRALSQERVYAKRDLKGFSVRQTVQPDGKTLKEAALNLVVRHGGKAAQRFATGRSVEEALQARTDDNPHIEFFDGHTNGYGIARFSKAGADVALYGLPTREQKTDWGAQGSTVAYVAEFHLDPWEPGAPPRLKRTKRKGKPVLGDI